MQVHKLQQKAHSQFRKHKSILKLVTVELEVLSYLFPFLENLTYWDELKLIEIKVDPRPKNFLSELCSLCISLARFRKFNEIPILSKI